MNRIFSQHVRSLAVGTGAEDVQLFDAAWEKLGDALQSEMRQRGIWQAPPAYLGVVGYVSWSQEDAFFELQSDCYTFSFVRRLPGLNALLENQDNIEGVVFRNIRNFLFDLQKRYDPVGYRVFCTARTAADELVDGGRLVSSTHPGRVSNDSILSFPPDVQTQPVPREVLAAVVETWGSSLLPDIVVCRGKRLEAVAGVLFQDIMDLEAQGIDCFRFRDLTQSLKGSVRRAWAAVWRHSEGEWGFDDGDEDDSLWVPWVPPDGDFEMWDQFRHLERCVAEAVDHLDVRSTTRQYLEKLWTFLCRYAAESLGAGDPADGPRIPSKRLLAQHLGIPRDRFPELLGTLGELVQDCQETRNGRAMRYTP